MLISYLFFFFQSSNVRRRPPALISPPLSIESFDVRSDWLFWTANPSQLNIPSRVEEKQASSSSFSWCASTHPRAHAPAAEERNVDQTQPTEEKQLVTETTKQTHLTLVSLFMLFFSTQTLETRS